MRRKIERENTGDMEPGQDLVVAGYAGLAGSLYLLEARYDELAQWFSVAYLEEVLSWKGRAIVPGALDWASLGAADWEESGLGGILASVWLLSGAYGVGVEFHLRRIPILQETVEICERLGCNPYRLYSRGCWLLSAASGIQLADRLARMQVPAAVVGWVNPGITREVISGEGRGCLERPRRDEILKILPKFRKELEIQKE